MGASTIRSLFVIALTLLLPACDGDTTLGIAVVTVNGQAALFIGGQTQLVAVTTNGTVSRTP